MSAEFSLLNQVKATGFESSVLATYNISFRFYEELVLPRLRAASCRNNVVLADARCIAQALADGSDRPRLAGRAYVLIPVAAGGAFHPKILLQLGPKHASACIGSHNATYAGWSDNREVTCAYVADSDDDEGVGTIRDAWRFLRAWAETAPPEMRDALDAAESFAPAWLRSESSGASDFHGSLPTGPALWDAVRPFVGGPAHRILVSGPFFDSKCAFVRKLRDDLVPDELVVAVDPETVSLNPATLQGLDHTRLVELPSDAFGYPHAKLLLVEHNDGTETLIAGSANPSAAAWLVSADERAAGPSAGRWRNAEAVVVQRGPAGTLSSALGIESWFELPSADTTAMALQIDTAGSPEDGVGVFSPALVAIADDAGFFVSDASPHTLDGIAHVLDAQFIELGAGQFVPGRESARLDFQDAAVRSRAAFLRCGTGANARLVLVYHSNSIRALSPSTGDARIRNALRQLDGDSPDVERFLDLMTRVIFDEDAGKSIGGVGGGRQNHESAEPEYSTLAVSAAEAAAARAHSHRGSRLLTALLDALLRRLAVEASPAEDFDNEGREFAKRSEEELVETDDESLVDASQWTELAATCQRRAKLLVDRLTKYLRRPDNKPGEPLQRTTAVVATVFQLRRAERAIVGRRDDESLVTTETRQVLLETAIEAAYRSHSGFLARPSDSLPRDISMFRELSAWLLKDLGLTFKSVCARRWSEDGSMFAHGQLARWLRVVPSLASDSVARVSLDAYNTSEDKAWWARELAIAHAIDRRRQERACAGSLQLFLPGSIVTPTAAASTAVMVVFGQNGNKVEVYDGVESRTFLSERLWALGDVSTP